MVLRIVFVVFLAVSAVAWRMLNLGYSMPNVELVTSVAIASGLLLPVRWSWAPPVAVILASDAVLGNTSIFLFTWSAWALTAGASWLLRRARAGIPAVVASTGYGALASTWFYLWTNFGVWVLGDGTFYAKTLDGLAACYVAGLPFYRNMLLANLVLVPVVASIATGLRIHQERPAAVSGAAVQAR